MEAEAVYEDCNSLLEQINLQEKELRHKRRWLIGLRNEVRFQSERTMPEYLIREDDVFYETVKSFVEKGAKGHDPLAKHCMVQDNMQLLYSPNDIKGLFSLIDNMTNRGLCCFVEILIGESVKFEKTRWKMKKFIKGCLSQVLQKQGNTQLMNWFENHSSLLRNPYNFRWNDESRFIPDSQSYHHAVLKILHGLEDLPMQALSAMHRKLRGKAYLPRLIPKKTAWGRANLIKHLRKKCMLLLSKLGEGDELQESLAKAMDVASLTLKLIKGCQYVTNFKQFSPEINVLQNDIAIAIRLLDRKVKFPVLKDLQLLLDPKAKLPDRSLRTSIRNMLTEFLFECSDMDTVPERLLEVLAIIKQSSGVPYKQLSETKTQEEVECILRVSACTKQVLWDLMPEHEFDLEFADAYVEDLEESDGDDICEDTYEEVEHLENNRSCSSHSDEEVGSTGDIEMANCNSDEEIECGREGNSINSQSSAFPTKEGDDFLKSKVPNMQIKEAMCYHLVNLRNTERMDPGSSILRHGPNLVSEKNPDLVSSNFSSAESNLISNKQSMYQSQYLAVQAASDETSVVAYRLIGRMLDNFAQIKGCELSSGDVSYLGVDNDPVRERRGVPRKGPTPHEEDGCSVIIKAFEELIPSFAESEKERLKKLLG